MMNRLVILVALAFSAFALGRASQDDSSDGRHPIHLRQEVEQAAGFSQAYQAGKTVYVSATPGRGETLGQQLRSAYQRIGTILEKVGGRPADVVMETIYTTDVPGLLSMKELRREFYGEHLPAASFVGVERLMAESFQVEVQLVVQLP